MSQTIDSIHTPCKNCVFAKYEDNTQIDCHLNYIEKYKNTGTEILEAYDEEKEFYIINRKKCLGYREDKWFKQFSEETLSIEDKVKIYNEHNTLSYLAVINLEKLTPDDLDNILAQLGGNNIAPKKIVMIRYRDNELKFAYDKIQALLQKHNIGCLWRIQTMVDDEIQYKDTLDNISMHSPQYRFIISIKSPISSISSIVEKANHIVYEELGQFVAISDKNKDCVLYSGCVYRYSKIVAEENILDKDENYIVI